MLTSCEANSCKAVRVAGDLHYIIGILLRRLGSSTQKQVTASHVTVLCDSVTHDCDSLQHMMP